jgi:hypothetical protein
MDYIKAHFKWLRIVFLVAFAFMQIFLIFFNHHDTMDIDVYPNRIPSMNIFGENHLGQTFIMNNNNLARLEIMLGTHARDNDKDVTFELWELEPKQRRLEKISLNASAVRDNLYQSFSFKPIKNSKAKKYFFSLSSPDSTPDNSICLWTNEDDLLPLGDYIVNGEATSGEVIFRAYAKRPIFTELPRIVKNYEGIFSSVAFLAFAVFLFEAAQFLMLWWLLGFIYRTWTNS